MTKPSSSVLHRLLVGFSRPLTLFLIVASLFGFYLGKDLQLKLSLTDLLPEDHPSVVKFNKITEIVGGVGYMIAVLEAKDGKSHLAAVPKLIEALEKSPMVRTAFIDREEYFFSTRMLYYLDLPTLEKLERSIEKRITKAQSKVIDLGLWDDEEESEIDTDVTRTAKRSADVTPKLISKDQRYLLLMIKPTFDSTDMQKSKSISHFTKEVLDAHLPSSVSYELAGRYYKKIEDARIIEGDIGFLGALAIGLIAVLLYVSLNSFRTMLLILIPVVMGLGMTVGATRLFVGHINIITGFLMGIVSGLGMDYAVHLALRLRLEQKEPSLHHPDPVWRSLLTGGHGVFIGAIAAAAAFFLLCFSSFRAFSEFGFVCGVGICAVAGVLLTTFSTFARWFRLNGDRLPEKFARRRFGELPQLTNRPSITFGLLVTGVLVISSFWVGFEYDFERMMQHSPKVRELTNLVNQIYDRSMIPSVFATQTESQAIAIEDALEKNYMGKLDEEGNLVREDGSQVVIETIISGATIIPKQQREKQAILKRIKKRIQPYRNSWLKKEIDISGKTIRRWVNAPPFRFEDLPIHLQDAFRGKNKSGYLMYIYPPLSLNLSTPYGVRTYATMVREMEAQFPEMLTGSDTVVFAEILDLIQHDGFLILVGIFVTVGLFIWINVRRWDDSLATYFPLLVALPIGIGLMALLGIQFNIFNIAIIPSFVAIGIDVPIHLVHRARQIRSGHKSARDLAMAVHLALLTTGIGFGVLIFSRAGVLRSLGWLAVLGIAAIWWTGLFLLPAYLEWFHRRQKT